MVTKESLLARKAQIEGDLDAQHDLARAAEAQRQDAIAKLTGCRDMVNALSGAKQDVEHWLAQFPPDNQAADAAPAVEAIPQKEGATLEAPKKEQLN